MDIEKGKPVHCTETVTGKNFTGNLLVAEDELRVDLFSYTEFFHIGTDEPVHLITEAGNCVSMHACIPGGSGDRNSYDQSVHHHAVIANMAVVGHDRWEKADLIKRVSFSVNHTMELMRSQSRFEALGKERFPGEDYLKLYEERAGGMTLGARYAAVWGMDFDTPKDLWPVFEIEFDEPKSLNDYIGHVSSYVDFLSFCLGVKFVPRDIHIDRLSLAETLRLLDEDRGLYRPPHQVHYVWPEVEIESRDLWVGGSPVRAYDEEELTAFRACLVAWMSREADWDKSYSLMMTSLGLKGEISAERLINACKWFEELPNAQSRNALSVADSDAIVAAAVAKAEELGHKELRERIAASISRIKEESSAERFTRLIAMVDAKFGKGVLPDRALEHLRRAIAFRGRTAHGHFNPESDEEYRAFAKSTHAMEALSTLLTALELPIPEEGLKRLRSNPVIRDYRAAYD